MKASQITGFVDAGTDMARITRQTTGVTRSEGGEMPQHWRAAKGV